MPVTIKSSRMQYRDSNGNYVGVDAVSERTTAEYLSAIETKGEETLDSIPSDYTALSDEVDDLKITIKNDMRYIVGKPDLLSEVGWNVGAYISATGVITPYSTAKYTNLIPVNGDNYIYHYIASASSTTTRVHGYNSDGDWVAQITMATTGTIVKIEEIEIQTRGYSFIRISESTTITPVALVEKNSISKELSDLEDALNTFKNIVLRKKSIAWKTNSSYPTGWRTGYFTGSIGSTISNTGSSNYARAYYILKENVQILNPEDLGYIEIIPPPGYYVQVIITGTNDIVVDRLNDQHHIDEAVIVPHINGHGYAVNLGAFAGDSGDYVTDEEFVEQIVVNGYYRDAGFDDYSINENETWEE